MAHNSTDILDVSQSQSQSQSQSNQSNQSEDTTSKTIIRRLLLAFGVGSLIVGSYIAYHSISSGKSLFRYPLMKSFSQTNNSRTHSLIIGCNYENTEAALGGCISDATAMLDIFKRYATHYPDAFLPPQKIFDTDHRNFSRTLVIDRIASMYKDCNPGDTFFMYFAGHGIQIKDNNMDESDSYDECCLITYPQTKRKGFKMEWLLDDDLKEMLDNQDVAFVFLLDCCHSGGMSDMTVNRPNNLIIAACNESQSSNETSSMFGGVRGIFTKNLERILNTTTVQLGIEDIKNNKIWSLINRDADQTFTVCGNPNIFKFPSLR